MSVVILGGNECMEQKYKSLCRDYRHEAKVMVKPAGGVKRKMGNPDLVIFFTDAMSHKMLQGALGEMLLAWMSASMILLCLMKG